MRTCFKIIQFPHFIDNRGTLTPFELDEDLKINAILKKDVSGNTIEVLQDITYDSNGNISQINDRTFFYNTEENTYYEDSEHMQDGVLLNTQEDVFYNTYYCYP